jgi:hypothetical protein
LLMVTLTSSIFKATESREYNCLKDAIYRNAWVRIYCG